MFFFTLTCFTVTCQLFFLRGVTSLVHTPPATRCSPGGGGHDLLRRFILVWDRKNAPSSRVILFPDFDGLIGSALHLFVSDPTTFASSQSRTWLFLVMPWFFNCEDFLKTSGQSSCRVVSKRSPRR